MRSENLKIKYSITFPFGRPDKNGVVYSKAAIEKAVASFDGNIPIIYNDNDKNNNEVVVGYTVGEPCSILWDDEYQVCEIVVNGVVYYGGTECVVNKIEDGVVTDFDIVSVGLSK